MKQVPVIAITIGDPNGIGPEVVVKALSEKSAWSGCGVVVLGPVHLLQKEAARLHLKLPLRVISDFAQMQPDEIGVMQAGGAQPDLMPGQASAESGRVAGQALEMAVAAGRAGKIAAIVTAPVSKQALNLAGYLYPGQTEFFAERFGVAQVVMTMISGTFRVALATTHCALAQVPAHLSPDLLVEKLVVIHRELQQRFRIARPRLAVSALNPHAGENGLFGNEESEIIAPAIARCRSLGMQIDGPFPADTLFARLEQQPFDLYFVMYHDQGLIPIKMRSFGAGVNYTAGLPVVRTSPDHGTAYDIAGKGVADAGSMQEAIKLAVQLGTNG